MIPLAQKLIPRFLQEHLVGQVELKKIIANTGWLVVDHLIRIFAGLLVGAWIARYLGPSRYGLFSYAIAFVALFVPFAGLGLKDILVRNIVRRPAARNELLGTAFFLQLAASMAVLVISILIANLTRPGDQLAILLIAILSGGLVINSLNFTLTYWFESQVLSKYVVWSKNIALVLVAVVRVGLILNQAGLPAFAVATVIEYVLMAAGLAVWYRVCGERIRRWRMNLEQARLMLRDSWPLIISAFAIVIYHKIDQIMLAQLVDDQALGIYVAAVRISEVWNIIPMALASSFFPAIIRIRENRPRDVYDRRMQSFFDVMAGAAYLVVIPTVLIAPILIGILFGPEYAEAGPMLRIHIWSYLFVSLGVARSRWLIAENYTKISMLATGLGAIVNIAMNLWLIPRYAGMGAAWATLVSYSVSGYFSTALWPKLWPLFKQQNLSLLIPFRIMSFWKSLNEIVSAKKDET